jgi:hypothetical protein
MMMPVMDETAKHAELAYRPGAVGVKRAGTDAFESGVRLSSTP